MKHKILIVLMAIVAAVCCAFAFSACFDEPEPPNENQGTQNSDDNNNNNNQENNSGNSENQNGQETGEHVHIWGNWQLTTPATCSAQGEETRVCALDSTHKETRKTAIDPDAHSWIHHDAQVADCSHKGHNAYDECERCLLTSTEVIETPILPDAHDFADGDECVICGVASNYTRGLLYSDVEDDWIDSYGVIGIGTATDENEIVIPSSYKGKPVHYIGDEAFRDLANITSVTIPDSVESIGDFAFDSCENLTDINLPDSITSFGCQVLLGTAYYEDESHWESLGAQAEALYMCDHLYLIEVKQDGSGNEDIDIEINENTVLIADTAIACWTATSIKIPASLKYLGYDPFINVPKLESYIVDPQNPDFSSQDGILYNKDKTQLLKVPTTKAQVTIPDSVTYIGNNAFSSCFNLQEIDIPDTVTYIGNDAFYSCVGLTEVIIPDSVTEMRSAFRSCVNLTNVKIPNNLKYIWQYTFSYCVNLKTITIPSNITHIEFNAFHGCFKLVEVINLSNLDIKAGDEGNGEVAKYAHDVYDSQPAQSNIKTEGDYIYYEKEDTVYLLQYTGDQTDLVLPQNFNGKNYGIISGGFYYTNIKSITIPQGITSIGYNAFYITDIKSVTFENQTGWKVSVNEDMSDAQDIDVNDATTNAYNLKSTYAEYYWHRYDA